MSTEVLNNLREAIARAEAEELRIADRLSAMVCERDHEDFSRTGTFEGAAAMLQAQLFDRQRTVDVLKQRFPEPCREIDSLRRTGIVHPKVPASRPSNAISSAEDGAPKR